MGDAAESCALSPAACTVYFIEIRMLDTRLKIHAQFRKSTRENATQAANEIGRGASRRGQFRAAGVSRFCTWICKIERAFSSECCNDLSNNRRFFFGGKLFTKTILKRRFPEAPQHIFTIFWLGKARSKGYQNIRNRRSQRFRAIPAPFPSSPHRN